MRRLHIRLTGSGTERNFHAGIGEVRAVHEFVNLKAIHIHHLAGSVVIVLLAELLVFLQQVIDVVGTKYQAPSVGRYFRLVESTFQGDDILARHLLACRY